MSALATPEQREHVLDTVVTHLKARDEVIAIVLTGSGAEGFIDNYSDIDLLVVLRDDSIFPLAYGRMKELILKSVSSEFHFESLRSSEDILLVALLNNYLELDLQFVKARYVIMRDRHYKVLFDRDSEIEELLDDSFSETQTLAPRRVYLEIVERIWQPILKCVGALNRNETWRALHMLEQVRNQTVHLAGMNHRLSTKGFAEVDELPEMFLVNLRHTIPTSTSNVAIRRALRSAVTMFFTEALILEPTLKLDVAQKMQRKIMPYIEAYS